MIFLLAAVALVLGFLVALGMAIIAAAAVPSPSVDP
jgi:hypothetical protein